MPQTNLQADMATGPGTQGIALGGSEDVSQGSSGYYVDVPVAAGAYGFDTSAHALALGHKLEALYAFFVARGDITAA